MTETLLIYLLFALAMARLILWLKPELFRGMSPLARARWKDFIDAVVWAGIVALILIHFVVRSFYIPSESMVPTLQINDFILVNQLIYDFTDPARGEVVVFHPPPTYTGPNTDLVKRVIGVEYDKIEIKEGHLYLNDILVRENFLPEPMDRPFGPITVKKDHLFVMGDNRNASRDSRYIGQVPTEDLVGRAEVIFFPPSRVSRLH